MEQYDEVVEVKRKPKLENRKRPNNPDQGRTSDDIDDSERITNKRPQSSVSRKSANSVRRVTSSESSDSGTEDNGKISADGFDYRQWETLDLPKDVKELYQFIARYSPPKIDMKYTMQPFIPDFIPAVGDIDAFLKVIPPEAENEDNKLHEFISKLGLEVLDEPCGEQSDSTLLHMKLRALSTSNARTPVPPPSISKSTKDTEKWITEVQALHANKPYPMMTHNRLSPDIDALMTEWPTKMEHILNSVGIPNAQLDCSLKFYIELMSGLLDIPLAQANQVDYIHALNTLFNLYLAVKIN